MRSGDAFKKAGLRGPGQEGNGGAKADKKVKMNGPGLA